MEYFIFLFPYLALFQIVYYEAFTSTNFITFEGWTLRNQLGIYSNCGGDQLLGGYNNFGVNASAMILLQLPPHYQIDISFKFWRLDSWDNENFQVYIDQTLGFDKTYKYGAGKQLCGSSQDDSSFLITINQPHVYQSIFILLTSKLNSSNLDKSWGFRDFYLYIHLCPAGCSHCEANAQRWECIPWILLNSAFLSVTSAGFTNEGWTFIGATLQTSLCSNVPLLGGFGITGFYSKIKNTYFLPSHTFLLIKFRIAFIDTWDKEFAYLYVDGKLEFQELYYFNGTQKDVCGLPYNDQFSTFNFTTNLDFPPDNESFGIRDIQIFSFRKSYCGNSKTEFEEFCDDGNIYPFDGCFNCEYSCAEGCSNCIQGICWECIQGWQFETLNNNCLPISQDEQIVSNEYCDDVMNFEICKNGKFVCPMNCFECEFGICKKCQNNYILEENICQPICQDLIYVNDFQCYDDNLQAFDQCHQCYEDMEIGCVEFQNGMCIQCQNDWNFDFQLRKCIPICGDNKIKGDEQCDVIKYSLSKSKYGCDSCQFSCQQQCTQCIYGQCYECKNGWKLNNFKCETVCGDLDIEGLEDCDDQNQIQYDGCYLCKNSCQIQCTECYRGMCYNCLQGWYLDENQICQSECGDQQVALLSNEECDDNNNNQLEQYQCCSYCSFCALGVCYSCQFTFTLINNFCVPICGDGLITENFEQCDDMNMIPYDGCYDCKYQCRKDCKLCIKGMCYDACEYGFYLVNDECITICGDGIIAGYEICDDNNDDKFDGCHECLSICPQNCQFCEYGICSLCDDGYDLVIGMNYCQAKCGDGLILDEEECDDHNYQDGDGCSQFCKIELNYVCKKFLYSFSECTYSKQPEFLMKFIKEQYQIQFVSLFFSQYVKTINKIIYSQSIDLIILDIDRSLYSINLIVIQEAIDDIQNVEYLIEIQFFQNMDLIPKLQATLNYPLYNIDNVELINYKCLVNLNKPKYIDTQKQERSETLKNVNQYLSNLMGGICFMAILLGSSFLFGSVLEVLQQQSYLRFINIVFPFNLFIYFESSNIISLQPLLNYIKFERLISHLKIQQIEIESYQKLKFYEINADFFTNIQVQIAQIIFLIASYIFCIIQIRIIIKLKIIKTIADCKILTTFLDFIKRCCQNYIQNYNLKTLKIFLRGNSWDILFTIFLQIKSKQNNIFRQNLENIIALSLLCSGLLIINQLIHKNQFRLKGFFQFWQSKHDLFTTLKKISFIAVLVLFQDDQIIQTIILSIICKFYLIYIIKFKLIRNKIKYLNLFVMELSVIIFTFTSIFYWQTISNYINYEKKVILGWFHIGMLLFVLFVNLVQHVKQVSTTLYRKILHLFCEQSINQELIKDACPLKKDEQQLQIFPISHNLQNDI